MNKFKKYVLTAALVIPTFIGLGARNSEASKIAINKNQASGVNVRTSANEGDNIIGLISDKDQSYDVIEKQGDWLKIDFNGKEAYVVARWFHQLDDTSLVADSNFREDDNLDSKVIEVLKAGTKVTVTDLADNGFVKVKVNDKEGYIYHNLLESFRKANARNQQAKLNNNQQVQNQQVVKQTTQQTTQQTTTYQQPQAQEQTYQASSNWAKEWIAQRESNGSYTAYNPNGGYYGRYQLNPSLIRYGASPAEQEAAADNYVAQRYGSWERAQQFWAANGWY